MKILTFFPRELQLRKPLYQTIIVGWKKVRKFAIEDCYAIENGFACEVSNIDLQRLRKLDFLYEISNQVAVHRGIPYDLEIDALMLARMLKTSESTAYKLLMGLLSEGIVDRNRIGRRFYFKLTTKTSNVEPMKCPHCSSTEYLTKGLQKVCKTCGMIMETKSGLEVT